MLPEKLIMDAWWLSDEDPKTPHHPKPTLRKWQTSDALLSCFVTCLCLVAAADFLIFNHALGLGLVVFTIVTAGLALIMRRKHAQSIQVRVLAISILIVGILPVLVFAQALSISVLVFACLSFVILLNSGSGDLRHRIKGNLHFWIIGLFHDLPILKQEITQTNIAGLNFRQTLRGAILPMVASLIFALLFISANPVLENLSKSINLGALFDTLTPLRLVFWIIVVISIWPVIRFVDHQRAQNRPVTTTGFPTKWFLPFVTRPSVRMTLIVSNLLFLVQGGTDIGYLFAGAQLPDGMTYAQYAHRGAYPLLATALLAGGITILAGRYTREDRVIKNLAILWMVQTLALLGTSVFRLSLYIDVYGLTLLRMWAAIWMGLVLFSIGFIIAQIHHGKPIRWLLQRMGIMYGATLYACCFFNFTHAAASYNFKNLDAVDATQYACELGEQAAVAYFQTFGFSQPQACFMGPSFQPEINNWREWSMRKAWLASELAWIADIENERLPELNNWRYGEGEGY